MALFNHEVTYTRIDEGDLGSGLMVHIAYDDAFGVRKEEHLGFEDRVEYVVVGGTATTNPLVLTGIATGYDKNREYLYVKASDGYVYECVYSLDEDIAVGDPVLIVEHMNHTMPGMSTFDWLATKRSADFQLNSIKIIAKDSDDVEIGHINIDPYTGCINFEGMGF